MIAAAWGVMTSLWARLAGRYEVSVAPADVQALRYPQRPCAACGRAVAHTRGGEWSWPHACLSGYGVTHVSGQFTPRTRAPRSTQVDVLEVQP